MPEQTSAPPVGSKPEHFARTSDVRCERCGQPLSPFEAHCGYTTCTTCFEADKKDSHSMTCDEFRSRNRSDAALRAMTPCERGCCAAHWIVCRECQVWTALQTADDPTADNLAIGRELARSDLNLLAEQN